ncbi:MAG: lytic transglycosylase domain-containing protein [Gaiellaceae bacterium]
MRRRLIALLVLAALAGAGAVAVSAAHGERTAAARIPAIPVAAVTPASDRCPIPARFRGAFIRAANDTNLPLALLTSVAQVESRFEPTAESNAGAQGLLQVMPTTAAELQLNAADTSSNVLAGARYLQRLLDRFGSADLALAAYNAGPTAVAAVGGAPTLETVTYVANVNRIWRLLHGCV